MDAPPGITQWECSNGHVTNDPALAGQPCPWCIEDEERRAATSSVIYEEWAAPGVPPKLDGQEELPL